MVKNNYDGITVILPMFGDIKTNTRSVYSAATQCLGKLNEEHPKVEVLIMADDVEYQKEHNGASLFDYYLSEEFSKLYDTENVEIRVIHNLEKYGGHIYQGGGRLFGSFEAKYSFVIWFDSDDVLAPCCVRNFWDVIQENKDKKIFRIGGTFNSFDSHGYFNPIYQSIWVQEYCINSDFLSTFNLTDETIYKNKINRKQGEDYLALNILTYVQQHNSEWIDISLHKDIPVGFWVPNYNSLSRCDPYYGEHLAGSTMSSSWTIYEYMKQYNKENGIEDKQDEFMKKRLLNMTVYSFYNVLDFIKTVSCTDYKPKEEDWVLLRNYSSKLRSELKTVYWDEIVQSDIEDELYKVHHMSDCRWTEPWDVNFYEYIEKQWKVLTLSYDKMMDYAKSLQFDSAGHEIHSKEVLAWQKRHSKDIL